MIAALISLNFKPNKKAKESETLSSKGNNDLQKVKETDSDICATKSKSMNKHRENRQRKIWSTEVEKTSINLKSNLQFLISKCSKTFFTDISNMLGRARN